MYALSQIQTLIRVISIVLMNAMIVYLMYLHSFHLKLHEWIIFFVITVMSIISIIIEINNVPEKYGGSAFNIEVLGIRSLNAISLSCLIYYIIQSKDILAEQFHFFLILWIIIGLLIVFNFTYWLITVLTVLAELYIFNGIDQPYSWIIDLHFSEVWLYVINCIILLIGLLLFLSLHINFKNYRKIELQHNELEIKHNKLKKNYRKILEENNVLIDEMAESLAKTEKWWKFW